jgi:hypothetical protein
MRGGRGGAVDRGRGRGETERESERERENNVCSSCADWLACICFDRSPLNPGWLRFVRSSHNSFLLSFGWVCYNLQCVPNINLLQFNEVLISWKCCV